jgi:DNA polymerase
MIPSPPPKLEDLPSGHKLNAGLGVSTILPEMDFETYSPAGFEWDLTQGKFKPPHGASIKGLPVTGAARYTEHPEAEVLCLAYNLKDGNGAKLWKPGDFPPQDLLDHISSGHLIEAWNVAFEYWVWNNICVHKYNFPPLSPLQIRCAAAKSRAHALPGSLDPAGEVVNIKNKKNKDGKRLITKFSIPRNPTKKNTSLRTLPTDDPQDANNLYNYCLRDIEAEAELSSKTPDLSESELKFWQCDHAINVRGIQIDLPLINNCISILEQAYKKYDEELRKITLGKVNSASALPSLKKWMIEQGITVNKLTADDIEDLKKVIPWNRPEIHRALNIREMNGAASVKKLYAMANQVTRDNRLHDLFIYHSARTGRAAGTGPQPQNLPNSGPTVKECVCGKYFKLYTGSCLWCGIEPETTINSMECDKCEGLAEEFEINHKHSEWNPQAVEDAIEILNTGSLECVEYYFGDAVEIISSCLRGMFISAPGKDLICSDYSAIEAVVLAALAGEQWRLDVFNTHGKIYETSASKITGTSLEEYELYKSTSGSHHPDRKIGKVAELASGYQGAVGAWKAFGADEFFTDEVILEKVKAWRAASPNIVKLWYGLENAAIAAVSNPGTECNYRGLTYICKQNVLYCKLLSGRLITYHRPILSPHEKFEGKLSLSFEGWNTNPKYGKTGWVRMNTYGGKLTENVVQATARDILAHAVINLEDKGYPVVLHVHDEIVVEVEEGKGTVEEVETIMSTMPDWAKGWPVKAKGGWRAKKYNK